MEQVVGGRDEMARKTGSGAHERFTGVSNKGGGERRGRWVLICDGGDYTQPQILKLRRTRPEVYEATDRIW